jgi:hypothetical protein
MLEVFFNSQPGCCSPEVQSRIMYRQIFAINILTSGEPDCPTSSASFGTEAFDQEWHHCASRTSLPSSSSPYWLLPVPNNENHCEKMQDPIRTMVHLRRLKKRQIGMVPTVVQPLADLCDSGRELDWRWHGVKPTMTKVSLILPYKFEKGFQLKIWGTKWY